MENPEFVEAETIDLRVYLHILNKWKWLVGGITLLFFVTSGILSFFVLPPVYQSKTVIMVKQYQDPKTAQNKRDQDDLESAVNSLARLPEMTIKTYTGQITNEALLRKVITTMKLDQTIYTPNSLRGLIEINPMPDTNLIELSVKNNDPALAAKIANTLAEEFLLFVGSANEKQLIISSEFLSKQLTEKNLELTKTVTELNKYRNQPGNVVYTEQEIRNKGLSLASYQDKLLQAAADYQEVLAGKQAAENNLKALPEKIKVTRLDKELGRAVETEEVNPVFSELTQMVARKNVELAELEARKTSIQGTVGQLQVELEKLQADLNGKKEKDAQLQEKMDQVKQTRDILADKLTQVQIIKSINLSQTSLQIVTPAFPQDGPVSPKKMQNMAIALVLGLMIGVGLAIILEFMNNTINKAEDVDRHLGLPILGTIPFARELDFE